MTAGHVGHLAIPYDQFIHETDYEVRVLSIGKKK